MLLLAAALPAAEVRVRAGASGSGDGSSWADACPTLQAGLARAAAGDQVWVAAGTYVPGSARSSTFTVPAGVAVYGGFAGGETALSQRRDDPALVVLSGEIGAAGYADNVRRIVTTAGSVRLDTLTITGGFFDGSALEDGAALAATGLIVDHVLHGGELDLVRLRIVGHHANGPQVVSASSLTRVGIDRCEISGNVEPAFASLHGATVRIANCTAVAITRSVFAGNAPASTMDLMSTLDLWGCSAYQVANCVFVGNRTVDTLSISGGSSDPPHSISGCTFVGNRARNIYGGNVRGCVLEATAFGSTMSLWRDEYNWRGEVQGDPRFVDRANPAGADGVWFTADDGLRLRADSGCIGFARFITATSSAATPLADALGVARPQGADPDCGAYEHPLGNAGPFALAATVSVREDVLEPIVLGGSDADGDALTAAITALPARGSLLPTIDGNTAAGPALAAADLPFPLPDPGRRVLYRPAAEDVGTARASFAFTVSDGRVVSYPATVTIDIRPVNDAPTIATVAARTVPEDSGQQVVAITGIGAGTPQLSAGDAGYESQALTVTATSSDPAIIPHPLVSYTSPATGAQLVFTPAPDASGTVTISVRVQDDGGTADGGSDATVTTFRVTVLEVNDPPRMDDLADLTVDEDAADARVALTGIAPGPAGEAGQTVVLDATSSDPALVAVAGIDRAPGATTAALRLRLAADASGSALIYVSLADDGGRAQGGNDLAARVFRVTVRPVNDLPRLDYVWTWYRFAGSTLPVGAGMLKVVDADAPPPESLALTVVAAPTLGALRRDGVPLGAGDAFTQADLNAGRIDFAAGAATGRGSWQVTWSDGVAPAQGPRTIDISVSDAGRPLVVWLDAPPVWREGAPPVRLAPAGQVTGPSEAWDGGSLTVSLADGGAAADRLLVAHDGVAAGQVGVDGATVSVGGLAVGAWSGGSNGEPLVVRFAGANATLAAVQRVLPALAYVNDGDDPGAAPRTLLVVANDGVSGASDPASLPLTVVPVDDPPVLASTVIGAYAGVARRVQLLAGDPDGGARSWALADPPPGVALLDPATGLLRVEMARSGTWPLAVRIDDGVNPVVAATAALVVTGPDDPRPHAAGDPPASAPAGEELVWQVDFDCADLGPQTVLDFAPAEDAPAGLVLSAGGPRRALLRWTIPLDQPAGGHRAFTVLAEDRAGHRVGVHTVRVLVRPRPGGGG
ncbi:MAG: Ig-like domain-containing protein [Planctomycetes bacterium]|nr:Ig-like domain-containing protein [Planctomycetota bacterium]